MPTITLVLPHVRNPNLEPGADYYVDNTEPVVLEARLTKTRLYLRVPGEQYESWLHTAGPGTTTNSNTWGKWNNLKGGNTVPSHKWSATCTAPTALSIATLRTAKAYSADSALVLKRIEETIARMEKQHESYDDGALRSLWQSRRNATQALTKRLAGLAKKAENLPEIVAIAQLVAKYNVDAEQYSDDNAEAWEVTYALSWGGQQMLRSETFYLPKGLGTVEDVKRIWNGESDSRYSNIEVHAPAKVEEPEEKELSIAVL